jgi:hypothetical protein
VPKALEEKPTRTKINIGGQQGGERPPAEGAQGESASARSVSGESHTQPAGGSRETANR